MCSKVTLPFSMLREKNSFLYKLPSVWLSVCMPSLRETFGQFLWDGKWECQILQWYAGNWTENPGVPSEEWAIVCGLVPAQVEMVNVSTVKALHHFHLTLDFDIISIIFYVLGERKAAGNFKSVFYSQAQNHSLNHLNSLSYLIMFDNL